MSDETWTAYKHEQRTRRDKRLATRTAELLSLTKEGFLVQILTPYCIRVDEAIDCYPIHNRWHDIKTNTRGGARDLVQFVRARLRVTVITRTGGGDGC